MRRLIATTSLACALAVSATAAPALLAQASAAPVSSAPDSEAAPTATATPRAVELAGTSNTRTFGSYRTTSGQGIRNLVIRSDQLSAITPADARTLHTLGVTEILDFRTAIERGLQPDRAVPGARNISLDVLGGGGIDLSSLLQSVDMNASYRSFVTSASARAAFGAALHHIEVQAGQGHTVLYHCTAGKDRTGWMSAVLLTILGVDRHTVEADYLASNTFRHTSANGSIDGVDVSWLRSSFAAVDHTFGSFDNYVHTGLGLTTTDVNRLKAELLIPRR